MIGFRTYAIVALALAGCLDTPSDPTWARDVQPIIAANCVRCHGAVPSGGAPDTFRLDSYDDVVGPHGQTIRGAAAMAQYMAIRVEPVGSRDDDITAMPPRFGLSDRQIEIISSWALGGAIRGPAADGNRPPRLTLRSQLGDAILAGVMTISYGLSDPDGDLVSGELRFGVDRETSVHLGEVHDGVGDVEWDIGVIPAGMYRVFAVLDDGSGPLDQDLGSYELVHADGNVAPTVEVTTPAPYALLTDSVSPIGITLRVEDPNITNVLTATIEAVRDDQRIVVADSVLVTTGVNVISWDTSAVAEGSGWTLLATVSDGVDARTHATPNLVVSHRTTTLTYADARIQGVFVQRCTFCHNERHSIPGLFQDLGVYEDYLDGANGIVRGVSSRRGHIYRRIALQRNMPPSSLAVAAGETLTDAERADLIDWLLGGAPE